MTSVNTRSAPGANMESQALKGSIMKLPVQVVIRDVDNAALVEADLRRLAGRLDRFAPDLMSCRIAVESAGKRSRQGQPITVAIDLRLKGDEIFAGEHHADADVSLAMHRAFEAVTRRLEDHIRIRRGHVKQHAPAGAVAAPQGEPES
jgi:ribosome-associated translation inhibitor RaiA